MAEDIFLAPVTYIPKPRWFEVTLRNPVAGVKGLSALGETVPTVAGEYTGGPRRRQCSLDLDIEFNPTDPDHLLVADTLDRIIKKKYAEQLAAGLIPPYEP